MGVPSISRMLHPGIMINIYAIFTLTMSYIIQNTEALDLDIQ